MAFVRSKSLFVAKWTTLDSRLCGILHGVKRFLLANHGQWFSDRANEYMVSPFEDHEVYDGHRQDVFKRDGPEIIPRMFLLHIS